jgi:hypothetical protein
MIIFPGKKNCRWAVILIVVSIRLGNTYGPE